MKRKTDISRRNNAIRRYEENPNFCKECDKKIEIDFEKGIFPSDARKRSFCSRSCSAKYNNRKDPKRKKDDTKIICASCGGEKSYGANVCHQCKRKASLEKAWNSPIKDYYMHGASRTKYASIRTWANTYMKYFDDREQKCEVCGYDKILQVAHKKAICDFDDNDLMRDVNSKENLAWLCPNHHAEFDRGLIEL